MRTPLALLLSLALGVAMLPGCFGPTYQPMLPRAGVDYGEEITGKAPKGSWLWVRGRVLADLDGVRTGDGITADEEILLVTRQTGSRTDPGPTPEAWLVVCRYAPGLGPRRVMARRRIFNITTVGAATSAPDSVSAVWSAGPMEDGRIRVEDLDGSAPKEIIISLWSKTPDGVSSLHQGFTLHGSELTRFFGCRLKQPESTIRYDDLDRDGVAEIIMPATILPPTKLSADRPRPTWPTIFTRGPEGRFVQRGDQFPRAYTKTLVALYEDAALHKCSTPVHDLHLGLIYSFRSDDHDLAEHFLRRAGESSGRVAEIARDALLNTPANAPEVDVPLE